MQEKKFEYHHAVFLVPFLSLLAIWAVYFLNWKYFLQLNEYGIYPRTLSGLKGVLFSPFLHGDISHIVNNSIALLVLLPLLVFFYKDRYVKVLLLGWLLSGLGTWLIGRPSFHIGASGLVYVLTSFLFFSGIRTKYYRLMAVSFIVVVIYGSSVWYMFPDVKEGVSWEGHLSGFLIGVLLAFGFEKQTYEPYYKYDWQRPDFDASKDAFMKHFDENGHFNPKPEEEEQLQQVQEDTFFTSSSLPLSFKIHYQEKPADETETETKE